VELSGLHILLTYQCTSECDHCFVWGSPQQSGAMTLEQIHEILRQAQELPSCEWIYFEGGEPFLFYAVLVNSVQVAARAGFKVGIVSNGYWATGKPDAVECLRPFQGMVQDLSISSDLFHGSEAVTSEARYAFEAAEDLEIPCELMSVDEPGVANPVLDKPGLPICQASVKFRGRAASKLADRVEFSSWREFDECPQENLRDPGRVHVDAYGTVHICQGLSIGNLFQTPLEEICRDYNPDEHPVIRHLVNGGPAELFRTHLQNRNASYADACHLCYETRKTLMNRFPDALTPPDVYGA
jgi:MoaA/NifB/PqqE/SkfB family radical SAM enzyme